MPDNYLFRKVEGLTKIIALCLAVITLGTHLVSFTDEIVTKKEQTALYTDLESRMRVIKLKLDIKILDDNISTKSIQCEKLDALELVTRAELLNEIEKLKFQRNLLENQLVGEVSK